MAREKVVLSALEQRGAAMAAEGRTTVAVAVDGRAVALIAIADTPRQTSAAAIAALR